MSGCDKLAVGPTHAGGTLDLLMTDVPDQVWVAVAAPILNSDRRKVFLKYQVIGMQFVVQYMIIIGVTFVLLTILLRL